MIANETIQDIKRSRVELCLLFLLYLIILPRASMEYDMNFWQQWALAIRHNGLAHAYSSGINYLPVYVYSLYIYDLLQATDANIIHHINSIKVLFICFDFLPIVVLCAFRQKMLSFKIPYLFLLFNIAYVFNSMVWGQMDCMYTNLCFLAIVTGVLYPVTGVLFYTLALNTKPQAIEFLPVIALVWLYGFRNIKLVIKAVVVVLLLQVLLLLPFMGNGGVGIIFHIATHPVDVYNKLSICAFNIWYLIQPHNPYFINDKDVFFLLSYKTTGLLLFGGATAFVWVPLAKRIMALRRQYIAIDTSVWAQVLLGTGLICLYFFYFNAQMHERYANPIIIFFFFYGAASGNYKLYILASIPYFLSLDKCFPDYLPIVHYKFVFASKVIALWYTATVVYGSYLYYENITSQNKYR